MLLLFSTPCPLSHVRGAERGCLDWPGSLYWTVLILYYGNVISLSETVCIAAPTDAVVCEYLRVCCSVLGLFVRSAISLVHVLVGSTGFHHDGVILEYFRKRFITWFLQVSRPLLYDAVRSGHEAEYNSPTLTSEFSTRHGN
jgi:hypothetical protein